MTYNPDDARWLATTKYFPEVAAALEAIAQSGGKELPDVDYAALSLQGFVEAVDQELNALAVFATFEPYQTTPTVTGDFRLMAKDTTGTIQIEWIGSPDRILTADLLTSFDLPTPIACRNRLVTEAFCELHLPGKSNWLRQALDVVAIGGPAQILETARLFKIKGTPLNNLHFDLSQESPQGSGCQS